MKNAAPITGPQKLTRPPPISTIITTKPESCRLITFGIRRLLRHGEERAGEARDRGREHEREPLVEPHVVADERRARLVLLHRVQDAPERRVHEPPQPDDHHRERRQREIEECLVGSEVQRCEPEIGGQALEVEQAVLAAGHAVPLDRHEPEHLSERDREQRVVDPAPVRDEGGDEGTRERRGEHREAEVEPQVRRDVLLRQPEPVGADAEVGAVPERGQPGVAEEQVVAEREHHPDHDLEREVLVQADRAEPQRRAGEESEGDRHRPGEESRRRKARRRAAPARTNSSSAALATRVSSRSHVGLDNRQYTF